jgi:hypothetical protein
MDRIRNRKKCSFSGAIVPSEKFKYVENETIFFQTTCVEIHRTLDPITYVKNGQIGDHRLSRVGHDLCGMTHKTNLYISKYSIRIYGQV